VIYILAEAEGNKFNKFNEFLLVVVVVGC